MATAITCPHCQRQLRTATPIPAGKKVKCPGCGEVFAAPGDDELRTGIRPAGSRGPRPLSDDDGPRRRRRDDDDDELPTRRRRDDDDFDDERPRSRRAAARRVDDDDDGLESDRRPRRSKRRKQKSTLALILSLSAAGVLLLVFLVTAFAYPGFLLPGGGSGSGRNYVKHIPANAQLVGFVDVGSARRRDAESAQAMEAAFNQLLALPELENLPELKNSIKNIDAALLAVNIDQEQVLVLLHTEVPYKKSDLVKLANGKEGKTFIQMDLGGKPGLLATPDDRTILLGVMPEIAFAEAVNSTGVRTPPELQNEIARVSDATMWGAFLVSGKLQAQLQQLPPQALQLIAGPNAANAVPALQRLKAVSVAQYAPAGNGSAVSLHATLANDTDAESIRSFTQELWDTKGKGMVGMLNTVGLMANNNDLSRALNSLADDLTRTFQINRSGAVVTASLSITEATYVALQKSQQGALAGGFPMAGLGGPLGGAPLAKAAPPGANQGNVIVNVRNAASRTQSANNLRQIGLAIHTYNDVHKHLPPQAIADAQGKPLLSWRVAILPYIEQDQLYKQFDLNRPWNDPHNMKLVAQMPRTYAPVGRPPSTAGLTYYQAFAGPGTVFNPTNTTRKLKLAEISDGTSNTIAVVEAATSVIWTKPDDIPYDPKQPVPPLGGLLPDGFNVLLFDGSVQFKKKELSHDALRRAIEHADGQPMHPDWFAADGRFMPRPGNGVPPSNGELFRTESGAIARGQSVEFDVNLEDGITYTFDVVAPLIDPIVDLKDESGRTLATDDDGGDGLNSRLLYRALRTGPYRIVVRDLRNRGGPFTLSMRR